MAVRINELTKDASFNNDDYIMKDGSTNGTRLISVQNAADDLARKSTVGLRRPTAYDEATDVAGTDYIVKDDASAPKRVTAKNAATSFAQLAQYDTAESVSDQDYILKLGSTGVAKVEAERAAADFAQLAGQVVGSEMVESAIAKGLADEALDQAINTVMPNTVAQLRTELSEGTAATEIVDGAIEASALQTDIINRSDELLKWDPTNDEFKRVTVNNVVSGSLARGTNRSTPFNATDPVIMGSFLYNQDGSPQANGVSTYRVPLNKFLNGLQFKERADTNGIVYNTTTNSQIVYYDTSSNTFYRTSVKDLINLLYADTPLDVTASGIPTNNVYLLQTYNYADGRCVARIGKLDTYKEIANYVGEHIPLNTNAAADTVDGKLTKALTDLGILNDVVDPDPA